MSQTEVQHIPMNLWGKDHWSTFAYIECICVDNKGVPSLDRMRCDPDAHPGLTNRGNLHNDKKYPTRLTGGQEVFDHDDWSCVEDMEREELLTWEGTGINPFFVMTKKGMEVAAKLREHKANGGNFSNFKL